jgi:hypothetical protein
MTDEAIIATIAEILEASGRCSRAEAWTYARELLDALEPVQEVTY